MKKIDEKLYNAIVEYFDNEYQRLKEDIMNEWDIDDDYDFEDEDNESEDDLMRAVDERFFEAFGFEFNDL